MAFIMPGDDGDDDAVMADINVTPLVDVMLVLLIIFMITAPLLHQGVEVELPEAASAESMEMEVDDPLVLTVKTDGLVYLRDQPVHPSQLVATLEPILSQRGDRQVFVRGDAEISYGAFIEIVDLLYQGGIRQVGLVTERITGEG
ncbi:MAG: ExbD/TolR family protein [Acidobacteriota bacterium]